MTKEITMDRNSEPIKMVCDICGKRRVIAYIDVEGIAVCKKCASDGPDRSKP